jgi:hypothetical protein
MNINELKAEANKLGFSIAKKITYEKLLPCLCSSRSRCRVVCEIGIHSKYYRCTLCGYKGKPAKTKYEAISNWNKAVRDFDAYNKHQDDRIKKLMEAWK